MRICCCLAGHLELARRRDLYGTPVVVGDADGHVLAVSEEALPFSVEPGIPVRQAEHLCPHATLLTSDPVAADRLREPDQLAPWQPPMFTSAHRQFEPPVQDREALLFVARALCGDLAEELGLRGAGAKQMRVRLVCEEGDVEARESIVRHPLSSTAELFGLAGSWIKSWQPHAPINEIWIELPVLEAAGRRQLRLWTGGDGTSDEVTAALERLQERHGDTVIRKPRSVLPSSPIPSQRFA